MTKRTVSALLASCSLACSSGSAPPPVTPSPTPETEPDPTPVAADPPPVDPAGPLSADESAVLRASLDGLAVDLTPHMLASGDNATFSPASIMLAFAMTTAGARGTTRDELAHALHLDGGTTAADPTAALDAVAHAGRVWGGPHADYQLAIANRLFGEQSYVFEPAYLELVGRRFGAPLEPTDFVSAAEPARVHINAWVAEQTAQRIQDLVPPGGIDASTALALVNAIYFHAAWVTEFDRDRTIPETFTTAAGESLLVPTMSRPLGGLAHAERGGAQIVELPYRGDELSMSFVLPPAGTPAEQWVTAANLATLDDIPEARAELHLPRFRIDPAESISLRAALEALGVHMAWGSAADFSAIAAASGQDPIHVSDAFHRAFVEVNEEGTEAAAATAVVMTRGAARPTTHTIVRFDRPFLFFLRDRATHALLFVGRVGHPR